MFRYRHHIIDTTLPQGAYGQTALADLNNDGYPEFLLGQQCGDLYYYVYRSPEHWDRYLLGKDSRSDVGAAVLDVDGDGWLDVVTGGVWYRNSRKDGVPFERIVFDPDLSSVHDVLTADMDGDGRMEIVTMSDRNDLRWYKIPENPRDRWPHTTIGTPVHAGAPPAISPAMATPTWCAPTCGMRTSAATARCGRSTPCPSRPRSNRG